MNEQVQQFGFSLLAEPWLPQVLMVIAAIVVLNIGAYYLLLRIEKIAAHTASVWDDALIKAARKPLTLILWVVGTFFAIKIVNKHLGTPVDDFFILTRDTLIIVALAWFLWRLITQASRNILTQTAAVGEGVDRTTIDALSKLGRFIVIIVGVLVILQTLGFSVSGVLAFGGIGGIAVPDGFRR